MEHYPERPAFISLNDHKENFKDNIKCCLINPSKGEMGVVSKTFLEEIDNRLNNQNSYCSTMVMYRLKKKEILYLM